MSFDKSNKLERITSAVSPRTGIISSVVEVPTHHDDPNIFSFAAQMADTTRYSLHQCNRRNGGAGLSREQAIAATIGEGIERYCSNFYNPESLKYGSYSGLSDQSVEPSTWILYSDSQYDEVPYAKFNHDTSITWVVAKSWISGEKWLVPASMVFLPYSRCYLKEAIVSPSISTGLSCRQTEVEAVLFGLYECVERDAFTIFWLNCLRAPSILPERIPDQELQEIFDDRFARPGISYYMYNITLDIGIPTFFAVAIGTSNIGQMFTVGSASNLDGRKGLLKAILETAQARPYLRYEFLRNPSWSCGEDFANVQTFDDHAKVYTSRPDLIKHLTFCTRNFRPNARLRNESTGNPSKDLRKVLSKLKQMGLDAIVVNLTTPDVRELGLTVVKVIIPGLQPLHGNHRYPFLGGRRLYEVPCKVGFRNHSTIEKQIFKYPHPFP
jgi:ribosomal protein S12 methylthiotransferase accessory factor